MKKYKNGTMVIVGCQELKMIIVNSVECLKGWRYELAFPKKDGTPHKKKHHRFYFHNEIIKVI